ncbi:MAG: FKBP-type peptidyl-prolyl cis-trans isomerase [Deltaproteobacteria bacterium]|nr:FKBP-type peptidyl-prolyl cis-trans isomerase [Deltaproteobacteria bacterium]
MKRLVASSLVVVVSVASFACAKKEAPAPVDAPAPLELPTTAAAPSATTTSSAPPPDAAASWITDLVVGKGAEATGGKKVTVHYTLWLEKNMKQLESSHDRNKPKSFRLGAGQVIRGWDLGVEGMKVGGKRKLLVPPQLGYGGAGAPPSIPGNATLVFEIELLDVKP